MFLVIDGLDAAGKSTQAAILARYLQDHHDRMTHIVQNPGTSPAGLAIRQLVKHPAIPLSAHTQALLFAAARSDLADTISCMLRDGDIVICDRWSMSTVAYQGQHVPISLLDSLNAFIGVRPMLEILIDIPVDVAMTRLAVRGMERSAPAAIDRYEKRAILEAARGLYLKQTSNPLLRNVHLVHGDRSVDEVAMTIRKIVDAAIEKESPKPQGVKPC